ncbi:Heat shock protein hsp-1 [Frankliniella fusca]|uniref:Heat shock protein hsp-1 n=1 Tax=Frankliniella fusca TaxID=407009 RepID=A0AAE1GR25_9NEOP|nr:Heat shock protein hsp-1 [Frankliniella fusca]
MARTAWSLILTIVVVVIALVVAFAQAHPGRDHEEALAIRNGNRNLLGNPTVCIMGKVPEVVKALQAAREDWSLALKLFPELKQNLDKCKQNTGDPDFDWWDCNLQAIRDTWEGSQDDREKLANGITKIFKAIQDVVACLKN